MGAVVILALFPVLYLFAPHLAFAALGVAAVMLVQRRLSGARPPGRQARAFRREPERARSAAWKDPWGTNGLDG